VEASGDHEALRKREIHAPAGSQNRVSWTSGLATAQTVMLKGHKLSIPRNVQKNLQRSQIA
jgi:hypothetical protein